MMNEDHDQEVEYEGNDYILILPGLEWSDILHHQYIISNLTFYSTNTVFNFN